MADNTNYNANNNANYNRNQHDHTDNNDQRQSEVHGGEYRNGRLSPYKNNNPFGGEVPNEYVSKEADDQKNR